MENTANLSLPYILPSQAQKHVTHNEALRALDAIVQLAVLDRDLTEPPASPAEGDRYIVATDATGAWAGKDGRIAAWQDGGWILVDAKPGWLCFVVDEDVLLVRTGTGWRSATSALATLQNLSRLGIGTAADEVNPFAAKLNKALVQAVHSPGMVKTLANEGVTPIGDTPEQFANFIKEDGARWSKIICESGMKSE